MYSFGTCLTIASIILFIFIPRDRRFDLSFFLLWTLVSISLLYDLRSEYYRRDRINRNLNTRSKSMIIA